MGLASESPPSGERGGGEAARLVSGVWFVSLLVVVVGDVASAAAASERVMILVLSFF